MMPVSYTAFSLPPPPTSFINDGGVIGIFALVIDDFNYVACGSHRISEKTAPRSIRMSFLLVSEKKYAENYMLFRQFGPFWNVDERDRINIFPYGTRETRYRPLLAWILIRFFIMPPSFWKRLWVRSLSAIDVTQFVWFAFIIKKRTVFLLQWNQSVHQSWKITAFLMCIMETSTKILHCKIAI